MADVKDAQAAEPVAQAAEPKKETTPTIEELQAKITALETELASVKQSSSQTITKANAESAEWKRKYRETLDEATRKEQERTEREEATLKELEEYKAKDRLATYQAKLISAGYDVETAAKMAKDLPEGVADTFFESQKAFLEAQKQAVKTQQIASNGGLSVGMPPNTDGQDPEMVKLRAWAGLK